MLLVSYTSKNPTRFNEGDIGGPIVEDAAMVPPSPIAVEQIPTFDSNTGRHIDISDSGKVHNASGSLQLVVWPLSIIAAEQQTFQRELQIYWSQHGGRRLSLPMSHSSNGGMAGVRNGVEIPLNGLLWIS